MADMIKLEYDGAAKVLIATIARPNVDKEESTTMHDVVAAELPKYPDYKHFILDVLQVSKVSSYAMGMMMKTFMLVKKTKNYNVIIMTEKLLQEIMLEHPEMFDFLAVFQTRDEALKYIKS